MTPLAHRITKELTLPVKDRTFNDQCGLLERMDDVHCFEVTEIIELTSALTQSAIARDEWFDSTAFLPAPRTWIEWIEDGERIGVHLESRGEYIFGRAASSTEFATGVGAFMIAGGNKVKTNWAAGRPDSCRAVLAMLAIINSPRLIGRKQHMLHKGLERRLANAKGLVGKFPLHAWTELKLSVSDIGKQADGTNYEAHYTGEKCLHFCRSHLRIRNGKLERVTAHWRGNPALGIKRTRYKVAA